MLKPHSHDAGASTITCVCKRCGSRFYRKGLDVVASLSFSTPGGTDRDDPSTCRTWRDWVIARTNFCDAHLPPIPAAVLKDLAKEQERRIQGHVEHSNSQPRQHTVDEWIEIARSRGQIR